VQAVVAGPVEKQRPRRALDQAALLEVGLAVPAADLHKILAVEPVTCVLLEGRDQGLDIVADDLIAQHQVTIVIAQNRAITQTATVVKVEEQGGAADKRLVVAAEATWQPPR